MSKTLVLPGNVNPWAVHPKGEEELLKQLGLEPQPVASTEAMSWMNQEPAKAVPVKKAAAPKPAAKKTTPRPSPAPVATPVAVPAAAPIPEAPVEDVVNPGVGSALEQRGYGDVAPNMKRATGYRASLPTDAMGVKNANASDKTSSNQTQQAGRTISVPYAQADYDTMMRRAQGYRDDGSLDETDPYQQLQKSILAMEGEQDRLKAFPLQMDLAPLMAALQTETGKSPLAGYTRPESVPARLTSLRAFADKIADARKEAVQTLRENFKAQKAGTESELLKQVLGYEALRQIDNRPKPDANSAAANRTVRLEDKVIDTANDKVMKPLEETYGRLDTLYGAIKDNNYQSVMATLGIIAKSIGADAGALSNDDIRRVMPPNLNMDITKLESYLKSNPQLYLDKKVTAGLKELALGSMAKLVATAEQRIKRHSATFKNAKSYKGIDVDSIFEPSVEQIKAMRKWHQELSSDFDKSMEDPNKTKVAIIDMATGAKKFVPKANLDKALSLKDEKGAPKYKKAE